MSSKYFNARCHYSGSSSPSRFGFVVSKQVGGAVVRNLVKRRLRALAQAQLLENPTGWDVVVRALPAAGVATFDELEQAWRHGFSQAMTS